MKIRSHLSRTVSTAVLTVSVLVCGCSTPGSSLFKTNTEQSILSWSAGKHEDAVHYAQKALQDNPNDAYAMMVAGLSYESLGYPNRARAFYEQAAASDSVDISMLGSARNVPAEELKKAAANRLSAMNLPQVPLAVVDPVTQTSVFTASAFPAAQVNVVNERISVSEPVKSQPETVKGGLDMLDEGDRNVVLRFLTFIRLRDEKYVTQEEWETRRAVNLGGLLPYTLSPAGKGLDMPTPSGDVIIGRLNALRNALEIRAITPREQAAEREIILEALLPANPFYRMDPAPVPKDILEGATALRRVEMLKNLKLISDTEAKKETAAIEKLIYAKIGMTGSDGQSRPETAKCIQKCLSAPAVPCTPVKKTTTVKKKTTTKKAPAKKTVTKTTNKSALCPC